jgi:hypothetical protein
LLERTLVKQLTVKTAKLLEYRMKEDKRRGGRKVTLVCFTKEAPTYSTSSEGATDPASVTFKIGTDQEVDLLELYLPGGDLHSLRYASVKVRKTFGGWKVRVVFTTSL